MQNCKENNTIMDTNNKNYTNNNNTNSKITLYIDADDTIMLSSVAVIEILNKRYNLNPRKTIDDLKDWGYRSIYGLLSKEEKDAIYESDEFYDIVKLDPDFLSFYNTNHKHFHFVVVTKGTRLNIEKKEKFLRSVLGNGFEYIGLPINMEETDIARKYDKSSVNMRHGIQIDDRTDALIKTNAPIKILYRHNTDMTWNRDYDGIHNLYTTNTWKQIIDILLFAKDNHFLFKK